MSDKSRIKVLHVIKSLGRGGAETLLQETLALHDHSSFEFHYIYFLPWKNALVAGLERNGGKVTCLKAKNHLEILLQCFALRRYVSTHNIQLVHAHLPWAGIVCRILNRFWGIRVIYTEHNKQERYHWGTRWLNRLTFNWQRAALAVSNDVAESIRGRIALTIPLTVLWNGVDTMRFRRDPARAAAIRKEMGIAEDAIVVGTVAVLRFQKRIDTWLDTFKLATVDKPAVVGLVIGDGILKEMVLAHRRAIGMESRVLMPGLKEDIVPWLSVIDVFMMTSIFEGLPVALLEAMSAECAVVATDAGGIKEVLRNGVDGIIVPADEPAKLVTPLSELINDSHRRQELAQRGRDRVVSSFSLGKMVSSLEAFYREHT